MMTMFSGASHFLFGEDLYNRQKNRNAQNTMLSDYNCAGFALGTFSWYCPSYDEDTWGWLEDWSWDFMKQVTQLSVNKMLRDFDNLRLIHQMHELREGEYAVAFRVSSDGDFHYIRQICGEHWEHKCGGGLIKTMEECEVFTTYWNNRYDGPIVLFAMMGD